MKTLTLAAAQITCQDCKVQEDLARATAMAEQAQIQGAQLVLFPEFMPQGYLLTPALWDSAEAFDGPIPRWLLETARRLGIYLGTSRYIYPGSPGREIIRLMEWCGSVSYTFSKLRKQKASELLEKSL
jgi:predicted amidohydrolase